MGQAYAKCGLMAKALQLYRKKGLFMFKQMNNWFRSIDGRSFFLGLLVAWLPLALAGPVCAWDFNLRRIGSMGRRVVTTIETLAGIKRGLDENVSKLKGNAKNLIGDADNLLQIKNKLTELAEKTQLQITQINELVGTVETHLKETQEDIKSTAKNVAKIDEVRRSLQGK